MPSRSIPARFVALALGAPMLVAACSIIESYGSVNALSDAGGGVDSGESIDSSVADTARSLDSGAPQDGSDVDVRDSGTSPGDASDGEAGERGVIVVGGEVEVDAGLQFVLTALDPQTGAELLNAREPMLVSAVSYDPAQDLWYVFESGGAGVYPLPTDPFFLHTRQLDPVSGTWTEMQKVQIPTGVSYLTTAVLRNRIAYLAYGASADGWDAGGPTDAGAPYALVILDTTNASSVAVASIVPLATAPTSIVGTPDGPGFSGGLATLGATVAGAAQLTPVLVSTGLPAVMGALTGLPTSSSGFGEVTVDNSSGSGSLQILAVTTKPPTLSLYSTTGGVFTPTAAGTFGFADTNVRPPAFSECFQMAFVVGANADTLVHAIALPPSGSQAGPDGGPLLPSFTQDTHHSGQAVYFEPFTNTVLAPFSQGDNFVLSAFTFDGTSSAPHLSVRQGSVWQPPASLRPNFVATRVPPLFTCSPGADQ